MNLHECVYWQRADRQWINLEPYLPRVKVPGWPDMESRDPDPNAVLPTIVYDGPQRDVPGLFDLLHAAHPRARIAPPYRELHLTLRARVPMDVYDEITVALDDGFFIGMVVHLEASLHGMHVVVREAAYLLARVHVDTQTFMPVLAH